MDEPMPDRGTPEWWVRRLDAKLQERCKRYETLDRYYRGDHPLPEGDERMRDSFKSFMRKARTNYMRLVVSSTRERLNIVGFRSGGDSTDEIDSDAWDVWQANKLDADANLVHDAALTYSDAYVIIGPADNDDDDLEDGPAPVITGEDPRQVIAEMDPVDRRQVRAAAKFWFDDCDGNRHAIVYLPDAFYYFVQESTDDKPQTPAGYTPSTTGAHASWKPELVVPDPEAILGDDVDDFDSDDDAPMVNFIANPLAPIVPVVRFVTSPDLAGEGMGEFEDVIDIQDRINETIFNRLVIMRMQAYRQRWAKGIQTEDEDGNDLPLPFIPGVDLLWAVEDKDAQFGDFAQSDLAPLLEAAKQDVTALVVISGLPPHYVAGDLVNASADALAAAESRLVAKVQDRQLGFGESWEQVLRIAFMYLDRGGDIAADAEVIWLDPERKTVAQLADAGVKKMTAGVPWRQRMVDMKYTPQEIDRMETERTSDMLLASQFPVVPPVTPPANAIAG